MLQFCRVPFIIIINKTKNRYNCNKYSFMGQKTITVIRQNTTRIFIKLLLNIEKEKYNRKQVNKGLGSKNM